ncbi:hypothetical protein JCM3766R1_003502 [Sporobolomyces carnicolor]
MTRRIVVVGLGNYTHPLTRHSVGQVLLNNLVKKAASVPDARGTPHLELSTTPGSPSGLRRTRSWTTKITIPHPHAGSPLGTAATTSSARDPVEILFVVPKALMNVCGKTVHDSIKGFLPPIPARSAKAATTTTTTTTTTSGSSKPGQTGTTTATTVSEQERERVNLAKEDDENKGGEELNEGKKKQHETKNTSRKKNKDEAPIPKILVLCDDLDLAVGRTRTQRGGGPRGHNGIRSLVAAFGGSNEFHRFWIGIGRPPGSESKPRGTGVADWVLGPLERELVTACEFDCDRDERPERAGGGGRVLESAWREVLRIAYEEP